MIERVSWSVELEEAEYACLVADDLDATAAAQSIIVDSDSLMRLRNHPSKTLQSMVRSIEKVQCTNNLLKPASELPWPMPSLREQLGKTAMTMTAYRLC